MGKDVLDELVRQILAAAPEIPRGAAETAAQRIRQDWGGARVYIKKAPAEGKALRLGTALAAGVPLTQAFAEVGVRRSQGYALAGRRWKVR